LTALTVALAGAGCGPSLPENTVRSPEDVTGVKIGVGADTAAAAYAAQYGETFGYANLEDMFDALKDGAVDCVVMDGWRAESIKIPRGVRVLRDSLGEYGLRFVTARENSDLTKAVNAALEDMAEKGVLKQIEDGYLDGDGYEYEQPEDAPPPRARLKLAVRTDFWPYSYLDESGQAVGFGIDVARHVCQRLGVEADIVVTAPDEIVPNVRYGKADFALNWLPGDPDGTLSADYSEPYFVSDLRILVRK
jgi:ABC-type amino acid transport substrate-binding protein